MPLFEEIQRQVGEPQQPAVPGASPRPSMPAQVVNPPAAAARPIGRPSSTFAGGVGPSLPVSPGAAASTQPGGSTGAKGEHWPDLTGGIKPGGFSPSGTVQAKRPPMPTGGPGVSMTQAPGEQVGTAAQPVFQIGHVPSPAELTTLPPGFRVMTPYGEVFPDGKLVPSPEGAVKYQQAVVAARAKFGPHPWANDPQAPPPPVRLGGAMINPFTGQWSRG